MKKTRRALLLLLTMSLSLLLPVLANAAVPKISQKKAVIYIGKTVKLGVLNYKKKVKWTSSNKKVATVTQKGVVTGKKAGKTVIAAKAGSKQLLCNVTVKQVLKVNKTSVKLNPESSLVVTFLEAGNTYFDIADPNIVSCEWENGWYDNNLKTHLYLTGQKKGSTTVTITNSFNKESYKVKVKVTGVSKVNTTGFDRFASYIDENGLSTSDGYVMAYYLGSNSYKFLHEPGESTIYLIAKDSTSDQYLELHLKRGQRKAYTYYRWSPDYRSNRTTEAYVDVLKYKPSTNIVFDNSSIQSLANSFLRLAVSSWRLMLTERRAPFQLSEVAFPCY